MRYSRSIIILISLLFLISCGSKNNEQDIAETDKDKINWLTNLDEAQQITAEQDKTIFVNFTGSDWCGWCFKLDEEVFTQPEFINFSKDHLVMLEIDFPRDIPQTEEIKKYNRKLLEKYEIPGFPTILLLDEKGNELGRTGYQPGGAEAYVNHIKELIGENSEI